MSGLYGVERIRKLIQLYCEARGVSPRELSLRVGENAALCRDILNGRVKSPRPQTIAQLAKVIGIAADEMENGALPLPDFSGAETEARPAAPEGMIRVREAQEGRDADGRLILTTKPTGGYPMPEWLLKRPGVSFEALRIMVARHTREDRIVQRGDLVVVDTSETVASRPGIYVVAGETGVEIEPIGTTDRETLGRVVETIRAY